MYVIGVFCHEKCYFELMITHPDHEKINYVTLRFGEYHYKRMINGNVDQEFTAPAVVNSIDDLRITMNQIADKIVDGEITITVHKITEYWDDIPSPPQEDLEAAIQIMDQIQLPDPKVPEVQKTTEPS